MIQFRRLLVCGAGWLVACLLQPATAGTNALTRVGPYGGFIHKVTFHPTHPSIVYASTTAGFYRSPDGGRTWQIVNDRHSSGRDMVVHAAEPNRVFVVALGAGVLASDDAGATLSVVSSAQGFQPSGADIEYSADATVLYVSTGFQVYRSTDHGTSWQRGGDVPTSERAATNLIVDPSDPRHLYMVGDVAEGFQSTDAGATWQPWTVPNAMINDLAFANTQPTPRIWATTSAGIWFSDDRGVTWTNSSNGIADAVSVDPNNPNIVYVGTVQGLLRTENNGVSWSNIQGDANTDMIHSIAIDPANSDHLLLAGRAGIARSDDSGEHWVASHSGIDALAAVEVASSGASDRIYFHASGDGIYAIAAADGSMLPLDGATVT